MSLAVSGTGPTQVHFTCGIEYAPSPQSGWSFRFDDVVYDGK